MRAGRPVVAVVDPTAEDRAPLVPARPRPPALAGAVVGLVDNARTNSDRFMAALAPALEAAGARAVVVRRKPNPSVPLPDPLLEELLAACDVVVHGVAD